MMPRNDRGYKTLLVFLAATVGLLVASLTLYALTPLFQPEPVEQSK